MLRWSVVFGMLLATSSLAAPNREPSGKSGLDSPQLPTIDLTTLQRNHGVAFGDWAIWRFEQGGEAYFLMNQKTGLTIYFYWGSNGWINYRTSDGVWFVMYPTGTPSRQDRRDLDVTKFLGKQPTVRVAPGKHTIMNWTITVTDDSMEFFTPNVMSRMSIRRASPEFTHNNRPVIGK